MIVYRYVAKKRLPEEYSESGVIVASDFRSAVRELHLNHFETVRLRPVSGFRGRWEKIMSYLRGRLGQIRLMGLVRV